MKEQKARKIRYTDEEMGVIKNTFSDNHEAYTHAIRNLFYQGNLTQDDKSIISMIKNNEVLRRVMRKSFLPEIDIDAPLHQIIDLWMTVELKDKDDRTARININSRKKLIEYIDQQLNSITGGKETIRFDSFLNMKAKTTDAMLVGIFTRNILLSHVEQQLNVLFNLAGTKDETPQETLARLAKDSTD